MAVAKVSHLSRQAAGFCALASCFLALGVNLGFRLGVSLGFIMLLLPGLCFPS